MDPNAARRFRDHLERFFAGHRVQRREFEEGPIQRACPGFHVVVVGPGPRTTLWSYISSGGVNVGRVGRPAVEFLILSQEDDPKYVERLAMIVHYHHSRTLGLGDTFPLGEAWEKGSTLDHALVCRPYPFGRDFEEFPLADSEHGHVLWILPITREERDFKKEHGLEALEQRFEQAGLSYWDLRRQSVVSPSSPA
jgi:hypothetical protein